MNDTAESNSPKPKLQEDRFDLPDSPWEIGALFQQPQQERGRDQWRGRASGYEVNKK